MTVPRCCIEGPLLLVRYFCMRLPSFLLLFKVPRLYNGLFYSTDGIFDREADILLLVVDRLILVDPDPDNNFVNEGFGSLVNVRPSRFYWLFPELGLIVVVVRLKAYY